MNNRIVPTKVTAKHTRPKWLKAEQLVKDSISELVGNQKMLSGVHRADLDKPKVVTAFACPSCFKIYFASDSNIQAQANLAVRAGKAIEPICPSCSTALVERSVIDAKDEEHLRTYTESYGYTRSLAKEGATYNTYVDRHVVYRAAQALRTFALKQGMERANVRYLRGLHTKQAGQDYPMLNSIEFEIDWSWGIQKNHIHRKGRVLASVSVDPAGNLKMPRVFKTADQVEYPFDKDVIAELESNVSFQKIIERKPLATDTPVYRRPDISRFRAVASFNRNLSDEEKLTTLLAEAFMQPVPSTNTMNNTVIDPSIVTPGQSVVNPADGKSYKVTDTQSNDGLTVMDESTQQEGVVPANEVNNLKPAIKTTTTKLHVEALAEDLVKEHLDEDISDDIKHVDALNELAREELDEIHDDVELLDNLVAKVLPNPNIATESRRWQEVRKNLNKEAYDIPYRNEELKSDLKGRDPKTRVPVGEGGKVEVGLTEFPKDVRRGDAGYDMPFKEMDEKQVRDREHFINEGLLPLDRMRRKELADYVERKDTKEYGLSEAASAVLDDIISITKTADEGGVTEMPIQYKEIAKKPKIVDEPPVIDPAQGKVSEAITKFRQVQAEISTLQENLKEKIAPLQTALADAQAPFNEEIAKQNALLQSYLTMIFEQLGKTDTQIASYEDSLYAAATNAKTVTKSVTIAELLKRAETVSTTLYKQILELKILIESERAGDVLERFIYKYPISEQHKKRVNASENTVVEDFVLDLRTWLTGFKGAVEELNFDLLEA